MDDWQDISSAPKDGTEILGWDGVVRTSISWRGGFDPSWALVAAGEHAEDDRFNPTHWQALPPPPR